MGEDFLGTMVSASIPDSTGHRDISPGEESVFFLILLLNTDRGSASMTSVRDHETNRLLETRLNSEPVFYHFTTDIDFDQ